MRALIVDDSEMMRMILGRILKETGVAVDEAAHGREALVKMNRNGPFDLMFVDWNMPVMDGFELVRAIRSNPTHRAVRIIMLTMEGAEEDVKRAQAAGVDDYMLKPFDQEAIREKLALAAAPR